MNSLGIVLINYSRTYVKEACALYFQFFSTKLLDALVEKPHFKLVPILQLVHPKNVLTYNVQNMA